jgi:hypothetical protein
MSQDLRAVRGAVSGIPISFILQRRGGAVPVCAKQNVKNIITGKSTVEEAVGILKIIDKFVLFWNGGEDSRGLATLFVSRFSTIPDHSKPPTF